MSKGYYDPNGVWVKAEVEGATISSESLEAVVATAIERIERGETTARAEMKRLLADYPSLKKDRPNHPLLPLAGLYAKEVLGG